MTEARVATASTIERARLRRQRACHGRGLIWLEYRVMPTAVRSAVKREHRFASLSWVGCFVRFACCKKLSRAATMSEAFPSGTDNAMPSCDLIVSLRRSAIRSGRLGWSHAR